MKTESIEELMKSCSVMTKKNGNVNKIVDVTKEMLIARPNGVSLGLIARVATKRIYDTEQQESGSEVNYSVVRHAVMKSKGATQFEVFDGPDGKMVRFKTQ